MGLRYGVGGDTVVYMAEYVWIPELKDYTIISPNRFDPGFNLLMSIGKTIYDQFVSFQFLHILILNSLLFTIISKYSRYKFSVFFCTLFIFYYYFATEVLRESLSVLMFVYFYKYYERKQWGKFVLIVFCCALLHRSALFLLILPFLSGIRFNRYFPAIFIATIVLGIMMNHIFSILNQIIFIADNSQNYQNDTSHGLLADILNFLRKAGFPLIICLLIKKSKKHIMFENPNALLVLFGCLALFSPIIFSRLTNYFIVFFTIMLGNYLTNLLKSRKTILQRNAIVLTSTFIMLYGSSFIMYNYYSRLIPYYSVFNPVSVNRDSFK